jgi:tetratricopeptide (TPR) repeat protein
MFYLLSVALYIKARIADKKQPFRYMLYTAAAFAGICAMVTKENAFTLPVSIIMVELCFFQTKKLQINFSNFKLIAISAALLIFIVWVLNKFQAVMLQPVPPTKINEFRTITPLDYLFTQFSVIVKYIQLLILPINQHLDYDFPLAESFFNIGTILCFLFLCLLVWLGFYSYSKNRIIAFGIFWFFITLAIESSIVPIADLIFEHRTYLPSFGFFIIMSYGIYYLLWNKHKTVAIALCILIIGANSLATYSRNKVWIDDETLLQDEVEKSPGKSRPHYNRGLNFAEKNNYDSAIVEYNKAIDIQPKLAEALCNRGIAYQKLNNYKQALSDYNTSIERDNKLVEGYYNRGNIYSRTGKPELALADLNKALTLKSDYYLALSERGNVYYQLKKYDSALIDFEKTLVLNPNEYTVYCNRGNVYSDLGQYDKAISDYNVYINKTPDFTSYYNRANLYYKIKKYENAIADYSSSIKLNPRFAEGYFYRGSSNFYLKNNTAACADWQEAVKLGYQEAGGLIGRYCGPIPNPSTKEISPNPKGN